jgi:mono/diheme cytochrome c family protein
MLFFTPVIAGLSTGHEIGLALVAAAFIVFALVSSFVLPRLNANFPGRGIGAYVAVCVLFFVAMIAAVLILGKEHSKSAEAAGTTTSQSAPATTTTAGGGGGGGAAAAGNPAAGKAVFASAGCATCHTLEAANSHGLIGPNLDQLKPDQATVEHQVENGGGAMPAFKNQLSATQIQDVAAFVYTSTH